MSRLTDLGEILDETENRENTAAAPKKEWRHSYETIEDSTSVIAVPDEIKGKFVYQDDQNIVKVSYTGCYLEEAPGLSKVADIQVQLYKKETPETLESLVTLKSDEMYNKHRLSLYVSQLQKIEEETKDEKEEFKYFRDKFLEGLREVIKKIISEAEEVTYIKNLFGKYLVDTPIDIANKKKKTAYLQNQNTGLFTPGIGAQGGKKYTPRIDYDYILNDENILGDIQENLEQYQTIKDALKNIKIKKDIKKEPKQKTLEDILQHDIEAINQDIFDKHKHNRDYKPDEDDEDDEDAKDKDSD